MSSLMSAYVTLYGVPTLQGFVKSISLSAKSGIKDALHLLTLWVNLGQYNYINKMFK